MTGAIGPQVEPMAATLDSEALKTLVVDALDGLKAWDIKVIDVRDRSSITDFMVIASGTSNRHVKALSERVEEAARAHGVRPLGVEGADGAEWILVDLGDLIVHLMLPQTRAFYNLEKLWSVTEAAARSRG